MGMPLFYQGRERKKEKVDLEHMSTKVHFPRITLLKVLEISRLVVAPPSLEREKRKNIWW